MYWELAPCLKLYVQEINEMYPGRPKGSDGGIGDEAHRKQKSGHNPSPQGFVTAYDITASPIVDMDYIRETVCNDERTHYFIWQGYIYSARHGFEKQKYHGSDQHWGHSHLSIKGMTEWGLGPGAEKFWCEKVTPWFGNPNLPSVSLGNLIGALSYFEAGHTAKGDTYDYHAVRLVQSAINKVRGWSLELNGLFDRRTKEAYSEFQRHIGYRGADADGVPGMSSLKSLASRSGLFRARP